MFKGTYSLGFGAKESGTFKKVYNTQSNGTSFVVPQGVHSVIFKGWGAGGGGGASGGQASAVGGPGGGGGFVQATIPVIPGETLTIYVGGGGAVSNTISVGGGFSGAGGGGLTGIFRSTTPLVVVGAGGGGGSGSDSAADDGGPGGGGGGTTGGIGIDGNIGVGGGGGTQSAGGAGGAGQAGTDGETGGVGTQYQGGGGGNVSGATGSGSAGGALYGGNGGVGSGTIGNDSGAGGGGGAGYYGGGGGEAGVTGTAGTSGGGGGGGSSYAGYTSIILTTNTQGGAGNGGVIGGTTAGTVANSLDADYVAPAGVGGTGGSGSGAIGTAGNAGRVVLTYTVTSSSGLQRIQQVANAISSTSTVTIPSSAQEFDLAILFDRAIVSSGSTPPTTVVPSGFTSIVNSSGGATAGRAICSYKILTSSDPGTSITGMNAGGTNRKIVSIFRPVGGEFSTISLSTPSGEVTDLNPAAQTIAMSGQTPPIIGFATYSAGVLSSPVDPRTANGATFSEIAGTDTSVYIKYCIFNVGDTPTDATVDMDDEGNINGLQSFYIKFT